MPFHRNHPQHISYVKKLFFPTSEGYVQNAQDENGVDHFNYVYNYTDHLGNVRLSYGQDSNGLPKIMAENNYYPFGLKHENYNAQQYTYSIWGPPGRTSPKTINLDPVERMGYQYKYNSKEYQDELGLNMYDYGARNYDSSVGRFFSVDRMSEMFMNLSPYQYAGNNPAFFIDVNGEYIYIEEPGTKNRYRYENGQTQHQVDGEWQTVDGNTILSDFVVSVIAGLDCLETGGNIGAGLVGKFYGEGKDVTFEYRAVDDNRNIGNQALFAGQTNLLNNTKVKVNTIFFDNNYDAKAFTTAGFIGTPNFVIFGHEMSHLTGPRDDDSWLGNYSPNNLLGLPSRSEIRASHYENMIRAESGLPLRTTYAESFDMATHKTVPNTKTTLIDRAGNSVYYNTPQRMYPGSLPSLINDGINASNGRILTGRYNYNGN